MTGYHCGTKIQIKVLIMLSTSAEKSKRMYTKECMPCVSFSKISMNQLFNMLEDYATVDMIYGKHALDPDPYF